MLEVLNPTGEFRAARVPVAERPAALDGLRVGVFSNGKPNAAKLVRAVYARLAEEHNFKEAFAIDNGEAGLYTTGAPHSILEQLSRCGVVIHGSGD